MTVSYKPNRTRVDYYAVFSSAIHDGMTVRQALEETIDRAVIARKGKPAKRTREIAREQAKAILRVGCEFFGVPVDRIVVRPRRGRRDATGANMRQAVLYAMKLANVSMAESARTVGFATHQSVLLALLSVEMTKNAGNKVNGERIYRNAVDREFLESEANG